MMRAEIHRQHRSPSREESHQAKVLQGAPNREDYRSRLRALQDRGQSQGKGPLGRDQGKVKDHQARVPDRHRDHLDMGQSKVRDSRAKGPDRHRDRRAKGPDQVLVRDQLGRDPGKAKVRRDQKMDPLNKQPGSLHQHREHQAQGPILGSSLRAEALGSRERRSRGEGSARCVRPPS